jgi:hypothetical protein
MTLPGQVRNTLFRNNESTPGIQYYAGVTRHRHELAEAAVQHGPCVQVVIVKCLPNEPTMTITLALSGKLRNLDR